MKEIWYGINSNKLQLRGQYFENYVDSSALKLNFSIPSSVAFSELGKLTVIDHCTSVTRNSIGLNNTQGLTQLSAKVMG